MSFNKLIWVCGGFPLADKSAVAAINHALRAPSPTENMFDMCMDLIEGRWRNRDVHCGDERVNNWPIAQPQGGCSSDEDRDWSLSE
jgi:hypothetical protein